MKNLSELAWENRFVERLPGDPETRNFTRQVARISYSETRPTPVARPRLLGWSDELGRELGIRRPSGDDTPDVRLLAGNEVLPSMRPYAARYGGHQFGQWAGQLGDGRAISLGEVLTPAGRQEFQLKGAGPTPYSRRADGRAVLRSSLREFLCSEAMHFLGVPTTRALSLVATGDQVVRDMFYDGHPEPEPGAIVCRVAPSFLRFGNFEILADRGEPELLKRLADLLITDHFPQLDLQDPDVYGLYLDEIARRTARMVTEWMRVGFVHGVMNTDNMSALGLTIDYGPYGWLEPYDPGWTPNTTDAEGRRYCYGNQPSIAHWNVARLCEAFHPLVGDEARLHRAVDAFKTEFEAGFPAMMAAKLGLARLREPDELKLVQELFELLSLQETDYTLFYRCLAGWAGGEILPVLTASLYLPTELPSDARARWEAWAASYAGLRARDGIDPAARMAAMKRANPKYVLRNYLAQNAIRAAEAGDLSVLERLLRVLRNPYDEQPGEEELAAKRPEWARNEPGCSALSCSS